MRKASGNMMKMGWLAVAVLAGALLVIALPACLGGGEEEVAEEGGEYAEAVPDTEMLALTFEDTETSTQALELETVMQAVKGDPAWFKDQAKKVMEGLNALLEETHAEVENLFIDVEPVSITIGKLTCKKWETDGEKAHWRLSSCIRDKNLKKFAFVLKGRRLDSTAEQDFLVVLAGEGKILPKFEDRKRGVGRIGYNFDNLNALNGRPVSGRLGIAYRAAGKARQLVIGLDHVNAEALDKELHGIFRYVRIKGLGGKFAFLSNGDYVTKDGDKLVPGTDGLSEFIRAAIGWKATGEARTVFKVCGGTVGEAQCVKYAQCWSKDDSVAYEETPDGEKDPKWDPASCAELGKSFDVKEPPADEDLEPPTDGDADAGAPVLPEPEALPEE